MSKKRRKYFLVFIILLGFSPLYVVAHPGRTDSYGCHTCRTNCSSWGLSYGEYHCHKAKAAPQPEAPIKSNYGPSGTGYTEPAPEYEKQTIPSNKSDNAEGVNSEINYGKELVSDKLDVAYKNSAQVTDGSSGSSNEIVWFVLGGSAILAVYVFIKLSKRSV